ncbi:accessory factor UbiK family protein [Pseudomonas sp. RIT-PI-S]|uniref:accessory factor UbiK family protein n=1 Tax=Pseudomonas sp. RIT-PI-S TaxID=3035295 RepID=UPI0021DB1A6F|nr:accessory factor UbiK family protein [Pseudomonas sp. RIT-PI-S]
MLAPKAFLEALTDQASRLLGGDTLPPRQEFESQLRTLLQSAFARLDLVSREEFDSQMTVLARTRAKVDALEAKLAELEARLPAVSAEANPPRQG